jgi:hypothetical protein
MTQRLTIALGLLCCSTGIASAEEEVSIPRPRLISARQADDGTHAILYLVGDRFEAFLGKRGNLQRLRIASQPERDGFRQEIEIDTYQHGPIFFGTGGNPTRIQGSIGFLLEKDLRTGNERQTRVFGRVPKIEVMNEAFGFLESQLLSGRLPGPEAPAAQPRQKLRFKLKAVGNPLHGRVRVGRTAGHAATAPRARGR